VRPGGAPQHGLIVIVNGVVSTHTLPERGEITIGRARENDVQIIDASVSRVHAKIRVEPGRLTLEDMGSANGSRIRGQPIEANTAVELGIGEPVDLGAAMVMVQHRPVATREWRIWAHGYFEGRLEEECARATRSGASFALLRLQTSPQAVQNVVQQLLANTLRADDVVGIYGPGEYEILLVERSAEQAGEILRQLEVSFQDVGLPAKVGLALFPLDGRTAGELSAGAGGRTRGVPGDGPRRGAVILRSAAMRKLHDLVERVAPGEISILILGDTGVGKELMAEQVHSASPRRERPFLRLNCAALSESLLESELFGHERGAFTGAHQAKAGLLETAQGGTVFLDEIGELPMNMQVKLLRVLEERQVWRVGGVKPRSIDVRFVAATNRDLEADVTRHQFRQDLFFRLNGVSLLIPPLRERTEEIEPLARQFIADACGHRLSPPELGEGVLELMLRYSWPGNIRELRNAIERAVLLAGTGPILREHFPVEKMSATVSTPLSRPPAPQAVSGTAPAQSPVPSSGVFGDTIPPPPDDEPFEAQTLGERLRSHVGEVERQHILDALTRCGGNQTRAARELGISRRTLISRLERYSIPRPLKDRR